MTEQELLESRVFYILFSHSKFNSTPKSLGGDLYTLDDLKKDYGDEWVTSFILKMRKLHREAEEMILNHAT